MNDEEFMQFASAVTEYLKIPKVFVPNFKRMFDVKCAMDKLKVLFPDSEISMKDDPLQMGTIILCVKDFDLSVRETQLFSDLIKYANNFEIYPIDADTIQMSILFADAYKRVKTV